MNSFLGLMLVHGMAAVGFLFLSLRYSDQVGNPWKWALSGLIAGFAPAGVFTWLTRDDWGIGNKVLGVLIPLGMEIGLLALVFSGFA